MRILRYYNPRDLFAEYCFLLFWQLEEEMCLSIKMWWHLVFLSEACSCFSAFSSPGYWTSPLLRLFHSSFVYMYVITNQLFVCLFLFLYFFFQKGRLMGSIFPEFLCIWQTFLFSFILDWYFSRDNMFGQMTSLFLSWISEEIFLMLFF